MKYNNLELLAKKFAMKLPLESRPSSYSNVDNRDVRLVENIEDIGDDAYDTEPEFSQETIDADKEFDRQYHIKGLQIYFHYLKDHLNTGDFANALQDIHTMSAFLRDLETQLEFKLSQQVKSARKL